MDEKFGTSKSAAGASLCGRCQDSKQLELQARSILNVYSGHTHCRCKLGRHTHDMDSVYDSRGGSDPADLIALDAFNRSKKIRRGANGRFVQASDAQGEILSSLSNSQITGTSAAVAMEVDDNNQQQQQQQQLQQQHPVANREFEGPLIPGLGDDEARLCLARLSRSYYGQYYTVSKRFCSLFRSGELYRTRRQLGISEQWVYLLNSGPSVWRAFCLRDGGKWRPLPPTPADACFTMCDKESLTAGTQLLVVGREAEGHCIWGYELLTDKWFRAPQMITRRFLYASASCGVHAFVAGGIDSNQVELRSAERYDASSGRWEALPDMIKKRKLCSGFYMDNKFYVIGGMNSTDGELTCGEEYDPESEKWREIPNMCPARTRSDTAPPLIAVVDNQLFNLDTSSRQLKKYCKKTNVWKIIGDVPVKADSSSGWGVAFKAMDGQLLLIGGDAYAWKPSEEGPVHWRFVAGLVPPGTFVFNCAVMSA